MSDTRAELAAAKDYVSNFEELKQLRLGLDKWQRAATVMAEAHERMEVENKRLRAELAEALKLADERGAALGNTSAIEWLETHDAQLIEHCAGIVDPYHQLAAAIRALKAKPAP